MVEEVTQLLKSKNLLKCQTTPFTFHFTLHVTLKLEKNYYIVSFRLRWLCSLLGLVLGSVTLILVSNNQFLFFISKCALVPTINSTKSILHYIAGFYLHYRFLEGVGGVGALKIGIHR